MAAGRNSGLLPLFTLAIPESSVTELRSLQEWGGYPNCTAIGPVKTPLFLPFRPIPQYLHQFRNPGTLAIAHVITAGRDTQQKTAFIVKAQHFAKAKARV